MRTLFVLLTFFFCSALTPESRDRYDFNQVRAAFLLEAE